MSTLYVSNVFFESTQNTGIITSTSNTISIKTGGTERLKVAPTGVDLQLKSVNGGQIAGHRNCIINGSMQVDQRNAGVSRTFTAGAALSYSVDRWYGYCTGANVSGDQIAGSGDAVNRYQFTGAASCTGIGFGQRIEAIHSRHLVGSTATLSVDLSNSLLTTVNWAIYYANTTDTFGTLASPTRTLISSGTFTVTSSVARYSTQISIPAAATTGLEVVFSVESQTSGTWTISNVQLELGSVATPYEQRNYQDELRLCQRYYEFYELYFYYQANTFTSTLSYMTTQKVIKRISTPSVTTSFSYVNAGTGSMSVSDYYCQITAEGNGGGSNQRVSSAGYISAEL